ncbi:uncharacterized protein LOC123560133 [Mercenaria mercenaria]|uniref:uncharacterized protein LOC123560133 n=1 Tax=Mercenaria mercenaria TaxID=6596 RepID=UPI00234E88F8|nr:uncharacterized protein LOC123560133 [Mercenaria mercenaria]
MATVFQLRGFPFLKKYMRLNIFKLIQLVFLILCSIFLLRWIVFPLLYELVINFVYIFVMQRCANGDLMWRHISSEYTESKRIKEVILHCIPAVPEKQSPIGWIVPVLEPSLSEPYLQLPVNQTFKEHVVILSPLRDASKRIKHFSEQLSKINYPHQLVSIYFGEEGSTDDTLEVATQMATKLKQDYGFRNTKVFKLPIKGNSSNRKTRHFPSKQIERRSHLAKARNLLTKFALKDEEWVLWIDSDVGQFRPDIIQQFLFSNKDVMVASALVSKVDLGYFKTYGVFDRNTRRLHTEDGGRSQYSTYVNDLKAEGREAKVDLVGACMLMIKADCLRKGLVFPEEPYMPNGVMVEFEGLESEGLAQLAKGMGFEVYGLPFLEIYHQYDPDRKENWILNFLYLIYISQ